MKSKAGRQASTMARHGVLWCGVFLHGITRHGNVMHGNTWHGSAQQCSARHNILRLALIWQHKALVKLHWAFGQSHLCGFS